MPESRNRPGHDYQKPAESASQRVKGKVIWAVLFGVFGFLVTLFAAGLNYPVLAVATIVAIIAGYFIGKSMEKKK